MALSNYTELQAAVLDWASRGDAKFSARIPDFIRLGEVRIYRRLRVSGLIQTGTLNAVVGAREIALPDDWLEFKAVRAQGISLELKPAGLIYDMDRAIDNTVYGIEGRNLVLGDIPSAVYSVTTRYYARPAPLATTSTNWVLTTSPDLFLYAALLEGAKYAKNSAETAEWGALFDKGMADLELEDAKATSSGSPLRVVAR